MKRFFTLFIFCCLVTTIGFAQSPGFFLDDWQAKTITPPDYRDVGKPFTAATTVVTVDPANVITRVSKYLFGNNSNPYMTQMVTEPTLINNIRKLSPNIIRTPGGNISSIYFWNANTNQKPADAPDSLYDTNGNKVAAGYWYGKNTDSWTLSIDNYYNMLQQTNSTGIITVNYSYARYGTGPTPVQTAAHLAADWVRYDRGRTHYWEIGNEDNGNWQAGYKIDITKNKDGQPQIITGGLYGQHFKVFADSMRKAATEVGATIKIGAQLIEYDASNADPVNKFWNSGYFAFAGNTADFYIVHSYYTPYNQNSIAAVILSSGTNTTNSIMNWMRTTTTQNGVDLKPIALTEWNIFAVTSKQMVSHIAGMHAAIVLGELIKNKFGMASRWDLANGWDNGDDHGMFSQGGEPGVAQWSPRPVFYYMYLFQKYFGDNMVNATISGSTNIFAYASTFGSGQTGVVLVNEGTSTEVVKIALPGAVTGNRYYWYTLTGDNDNGEFSRKVLINGVGPSGVAGGPDNMDTIKANSSVSGNDIRVSLPARSVAYVLVDKPNSVTGTIDIDPNNKLIHISPNPSVNGHFVLSFNGFTAADRFDIQVINQLGQILIKQQSRGVQNLPINHQLPAGVYLVQVVTQKGTTIKKLVVN